MTGLISYDLVMEPEMDFVEGTFQLPNGEWQVFVTVRRAVPSIRCSKGQWPSGATGLTITVPFEARLDQEMIERTLSAQLGIERWDVVKGPDSLAMR